MSIAEERRFNLQQLPRSHRQKFAWLGILPPDAVIFPRMAMTLWEVEEEEAREILEDFGDRGWLQQQELADETLGFSLLDTVRDLARECLIASGEGEGLGFTDLAAAHRVLLARYQSQIEGGLWHTLPDDGYIYERLTWHLEQAGWCAELHELLQEETKEGRNGWYIACERAERGTEGFLRDVVRAWRLAEDLFEEEPRCAIALQVRYALITASINSLVKDIPGKLIVALIEQKIWHPMQGCYWLKQPLDSEENVGVKIEAWVTVSPYLPPSLLPKILADVLAIACQLDRLYLKKEVITQQVINIVSLAPEDLAPKVLDAIANFRDERLQAQLIHRLIPLLPESSFSRTLEIVPQLLDEERRVSIFGRLLARIPRSLLSRALDAARQFPNDFEKARAFQELVKRFPECLIEALDVASCIRDESERADALSLLTERFPIVFSEALEATRQVRDESKRAEILTRLSCRFPEIGSEALDAISTVENERDRRNLLSDLASELPKPYLPQILTLASQFQDYQFARFYQFEVLEKLVATFPEILPQALDTACKIPDPSRSVEALNSLASQIPESLPQVLDRVRQVFDESWQAMALSVLACQFPEIVPQALDADTVMALELFALHRPERIFALFPDVFVLADRVGSDNQKLYVLERIAPYIPENVLSETADWIFRQEEFWQAKMLSLVVPRFPENLLLRVLNALPQVIDTDDLSTLLTALAGCLPDHLLPRALDAICQLPARQDSLEPILSGTDLSPEYEPRARPLIVLAPRLPEHLLPQALDAAYLLRYQYFRADVLGTFAPYLPKNLLLQALDAARQFQDERDRALALYRIAPHIPERIPAILQEARQCRDRFEQIKIFGLLVSHLPEIVPEAFEIACQIDDESERTQALERLIPYLKENLLASALSIAFLLNRYDRLRVLECLMPRLPESLLWQAVEIARQIADESQQAEIFRYLVSYLPEVVPEALNLACQLQDEFNRVLELRALVPHLSRPLLLQALEVTRQMKDESNRAASAIALAAPLPEIIPEVFDTLSRVTDEYQRVDLLNLFTPNLPERFLQQALEMVRQVRDESQLAKGLSDLVGYLPEIVPEALDAIARVSDEDDRADGLEKLAPHLPPRWLPQVLEIVDGCDRKFSKALVLNKLVGRFPEVLPRAIEVICNPNEESISQDDMLETLALQLSDNIPEALKIIDLLPERSQTQILRTIVFQLSKEQHNDFSLWRDRLHLFERHRREDFLNCLLDLVPTIINLSGRETLADIAEIIQDVGRQWQ
ncbi:MAG: hypothetical protein AAGA60_22270 [Cyanobacteria bacterium P01_E01_bin.42]